MRVGSLISVALGVLPLAVACGSSESGSSGPPPPYSSGLDPDEPLSTVSDEEAQVLCEEMQEYAADKLSQAIPLARLCTFEAYAALEESFDPDDLPTDADIQAACADERDACIADPPLAVENAFEPDTGACGDAMAPMCDAAIGDYEECFNWQIDASIEFTSQIPSCEDLTLSLILQLALDPESVLETPVPPAACDRLEAECGAEPTGPGVPSGTEEDPGTGAGGAGG